jgi:hypothetical protein
MAGDKDDWKISIHGPQHAVELQAIDLGHADIGYDCTCEVR